MKKFASGLLFFGVLISAPLKAQYCAAAGPACDKTGQTYIDQVQVNGFTKGGTGCALAGGNSPGYSDFTADTISLAPGSTSVMTVTTAPFEPADNVTVYIDWNRDNDFADADESLSATDNSSNVIFGYFNVVINVPAGATPGTTRMRIRSYWSVDTPVSSPCGTTTYGEVEDYSLRVATPVDYCAASGPANCMNLVFTNGSQVADTAYYFITRVAADGDNGGFNNATNCDGYGNFTSMMARWSVGNPYDVIVESGPALTILNYQAAVFIDWNNDLDFEDAGESFPGPVGPPPYTFTFTPPANTTSGLKRMRIRTSYAQNIPASCGTQPNGEVEDYTIHVVNPVFPSLPCVAEAGVMPADSSSRNCTGLDSLRWNKVAGATGYKVSLFDVSSSTYLIREKSVTDTVIAVPGPLTALTWYKWIAVPFNASESAVACDTLAFRTAQVSDPVASILPAADPVVICEGMIVSLDGNPTQGTAPLSHQWTGINSPITNLTPSDKQLAEFTGTEGEYSYRYTVTDANGCKGSDIIKIKVNGIPQPGKISPGGAKICSGEQQIFSYTTPSGTTATWEESPSNSGFTPSGTITSLGADQYSTPALTATTYYRISVTDNLTGCGSHTETVEVVVKNLPVMPLVSVTQQPVNCTGDSIVLQVNSTDQVVWNDAAATKGNKMTTYVSGTFAARVTNSDGCFVNTSPVTVTIHDKPAVPLVSVIGSNPACTGDVVSLKTSSPEQIRWNDAAMTMGPVLNLTQGGTFIATAYTLAGCSTASAPVTVVYNSYPAKPVITMVSNGPLCEGASAVLNSSGGSNGLWNTGERGSAITVNTSGNYSVTVANGNCSISSDPYTVNFAPVPPQPVVTQNGNTLTSSVSGASYQWYREGLSVAGATQRSYVANITAAYTVVVYGPTGCSNESEPFRFSGVGIEESGVLQSISLYPNPGNGSFTLDLSGLAGTVLITLSEPSGRIINTTEKTADIHQMQYSLAPGIYYLRIEHPGGTRVLSLSVK